MVSPLTTECLRACGRLVFAAFAAAILAGCAVNNPEFDAAWARAGQPQTTAGKAAAGKAPVVGRYKLGAPYEAAGLWYVPAVEKNYDETGMASWYGQGFDGKPTANGEIFDASLPSAAHATLPMPSVVEVTNLENGKAMQLRLNDRGPFKPGRILDLSPAAARELGFYEKGSAKVRVRYVGVAPLDPRDGRPMTARSEPVPRSFPGGLPPEAAPPPQPVIAPPLGPPPGDGFVVQAGAFSDRGRAGRVAAAVSKAGPAEIRPLERDGSTLYRVVIGYWRDPEAARAARETIAGLGYAEAKVVKAF